MQILNHEVTSSYINSVIQLAEGEAYNEMAILAMCHGDCKEPRRSSVIGNFPGEKGKYSVSIKIGYEPYDDVFAEMVREYGKA